MTLWLYDTPLPIHFDVLTALVHDGLGYVAQAIPRELQPLMVYKNIKASDDHRLWVYWKNPACGICGSLKASDISGPQTTAALLELFPPKLREDDWPDAPDLYGLWHKAEAGYARKRGKKVERDLERLRNAARLNWRRRIIFRAVEGHLHDHLVRAPDLVQLVPSDLAASKDYSWPTRKRPGRPVDWGKRREINRLMEQENLTMAEVAERLHIDVETVKHHRRLRPPRVP